MFDLEYIERKCECCGGEDLEKLWEYTHSASTRSGVYRFHVRNVICVSCGFVFTSPVPTMESLNKYYQDSYSYCKGQRLDYDIDKRLRFISSHMKESSLFVEIGSNQKGIFQKEIEKLFKSVLTVELNCNTEANFRSINDIPENIVDLVAHYFVLEHIPNVRLFLKHCYNILHDGGVMICEVPDLLLYSHDYSGLMFHEHTNHFNIDTLSQIALQVGFKLLRTSNADCSRKFGFVAAFVKDKIKKESCLKSYYKENREYFIKGLHNIELIQNKLSEARQALKSFMDDKKRLIFWVANDVLTRFLEDKAPPENIIVVDSNPEKRHYFNNFIVFLPEEVSQEIINSDAIFIFSDLHSADILTFIVNKFGKVYSSDNIVTVKLI